jgi:hypothetical protein
MNNENKPAVGVLTDREVMKDVLLAMRSYAEAQRCGFKIANDAIDALCATLAALSQRLNSSLLQG